MTVDWEQVLAAISLLVIAFTVGRFWGGDRRRLQNLIAGQQEMKGAINGLRKDLGNYVTHRELDSRLKAIHNDSLRTAMSVHDIRGLVTSALLIFARRSPDEEEITDLVNHYRNRVIKRRDIDAERAEDFEDDEDNRWNR